MKKSSAPLSIEIQGADESRGVFYVRKPGGGDFRLAVFTDLHLDFWDQASSRKTLRYLKENIAALRPDLAAVLGDTVLLPPNGLRTRLFARFMEKTGAAWTAVLGNHEGEHWSTVPRESVLRLYKKSGNFLGCVSLPGAAGFGNQAIAVQNGAGGVSHLLFFLDSGGGEPSHPFTDESQIDWLRRTAQAEQAASCTLFQHVPPRQFRSAWEATERGGAQLLCGQLRESVCTPDKTGETAEHARQAGVKTFVCGHDHTNDFDVLYDGARYIYALSGGYSRLWGCYGERARGVRGCTLFLLREDGTMEVERRRNQA